MKRTSAWFLFLLMAFFGCINNDSGVFPKAKIACVGTSITAGLGVGDSLSYPSQLRRLLKEGQTVKNYGVSGSTVLKKGDKPYLSQPEFREALAWRPDIVVIELGTNDSKLNNWEYRADFKKDYIELIEWFQRLPNAPTVYVCKPIPAYDESFGVQPQILRLNITPMIEEIAKETNVRIIDLYTPMADIRQFLSDGLHPNKEGSAILANTVYLAIR